MTEHGPPPPEERRGMVQWAVQVVRELSIQNVLTAGMLVVIAIPSFFAYRFLTDKEFRREFTQGAEIVDANVPCLVITGNLAGRTGRTTAAAAYALRERVEYLIALTAPDALDSAGVVELCKHVHEEVKIIQAAEPKGTTP